MIPNVPVLPLLIGVGAGFLAGLAYFGGLWWTARRIAKVKAALPLVAGSFVLRMALLLVVLYAATQGRPGPLLASLIGVWLARKVAIAYVGSGRGATGQFNV